MYTIMYSFHCFFKEKHCTLIVYITEFFLKSGGAKCITGPPPPSKIWGGHGPLAPPVADPMGDCLETLLKSKFNTNFYFNIIKITRILKSCKLII